MSDVQKREMKIKLWQVLLIIVLVGLALAWLLMDIITMP
jgi:hypothetical protein